jgi:hypothetical protein
LKEVVLLLVIDLPLGTQEMVEELLELLNTWSGIFFNLLSLKYGSIL